MNSRKIALGPGAASLILIVVVLSLCMMAMLTQISARNDYSLSTRSVEMISKVYDISAASEKKMAELDEALVQCLAEAGDKDGALKLLEDRLPEDMEIDGDEVSWLEPLDNRTLNCRVKIQDPGALPRVIWVEHKLVVEEPEGDWEW